MANIKLKYPDGRIEEKELLTAISKDGLNIAVINLDNVVNGNKVTGVLHLDQNTGYYQNEPDPNLWKNIMAMLISSIKGEIAESEYVSMEGKELNVTADPYRQLALKDANYVTLVQNYSNAMANLNKVEPTEVAPSLDVQKEEPATLDDNVKVEEPVLNDNILNGPAINPLPNNESVINEPVTESVGEPTMPTNESEETKIDMNGAASLNVEDSPILGGENTNSTSIANPFDNLVNVPPVEQSNATAPLEGKEEVKAEDTASLADLINAAPLEDNQNNLTPDVANMAPLSEVTPQPVVEPSIPEVELSTPEPVINNPLDNTNNSLEENNNSNALIIAIEEIYKRKEEEMKRMLDAAKAETLEAIKNALGNNKVQANDPVISQPDMAPLPFEEPSLELNKKVA